MVSVVNAQLCSFISKAASYVNEGAWLCFPQTFQSQVEAEFDHSFMTSKCRCSEILQMSSVMSEATRETRLCQAHSRQEERRFSKERKADERFQMG